jgi:hypothetical protein
MVTIVGYQQREGQNGPFIALNVIGDVEPVQSLATGKWYFTARKCSFPSTFDMATAQMMVGRTIQGDIVRVPCDSYNYKLENGESITLAHTYTYQPPKQMTAFPGLQIPPVLTGLAG